MNLTFAHYFNFSGQKASYCNGTPLYCVSYYYYYYNAVFNTLCVGRSVIMMKSQVREEITGKLPTFLCSCHQAAVYVGVGNGKVTTVLAMSYKPQWHNHLQTQG